MLREEIEHLLLRALVLEDVADLGKQRVLIESRRGARGQQQCEIRDRSRAEVYVVTTPQPAAQKVAQRAGFMAQKVNLEVKGVIENMSWFTGDDGKRYEIFGSGGGESLAETLGAPLLGQIPLDPSTREFADAGAPIVLQDPDSEVAQAFVTTAKEIVNLAPPEPRASKRISLPLAMGPQMSGHQHAHTHAH